MGARHGLLLIGAFAALTATKPALADVTAEYVGENERQRMLIELADNGDLRVAFGSDGYTLIAGGKGYSVDAGPGGPLVTTAEVKAYETRRAIEAGEIHFLTDESDEQPDFLHFVPGDPIELAGFRGIEYWPERGSHTSIGIADDPSLAPLGQAYLRFWRLADEISANPDVIPDNLGELLASRGVLRFGGMDLRSVSFEPIDPTRFALPAEPLLLEQVLAGERAEPVRRNDDLKPASPIVRAVYFDRALWTLTRDGKLARWTEGAATSVAADTPGPVAAICKMAEGLLLVTGNLDEGGIVKLWSGTAGDWTEETNFRQSRENPFLALDCSGEEPLLLTAKALQLPRSGRTIAIDPEKLAPGGYFTTLLHGGYLYVGSNAGEWGGGLRRFSLATGAAEVIDASDPNDLCGGALNMSCDPVTGLTPDPARPDCVLVSVGLVHFFSSGQVVRVCDGSIAVAYRKPYTLDPDWEAKPVEADSSSSVPFYSMAPSEGASWAVASDGLYRFGVEERPDFTPFGRTKHLPASGVDWSDRRFVLVATAMNQSHSLSGQSLILVPRLSGRD